MYLRFVYSKLVDGMHSREGIFQAATEFVYAPLSAGEAVDRAQEIRQWFGQNLDRPYRFCRSSSKGNYNRQTRGLSWFKPTAKEHISKAFELKSILDEHGFAIEVLKEKRLGYVVFEDTYQIVAEPFVETLT